MQNRKGIQVKRAVNDCRQMWEEDVRERTFCIVYLSNLYAINRVTLF